MKRVLAVFVVLVICMSMFGMLSPKTMAQSPQPTSVTVSCSPNPAEADSPVTITAVVTGQNPTGSITWSSETTSISNQEGVEGSFTSNVSLVSANGISTTTFYDSIYGSDLITATYSGDSFNSPSVGTSTLTLVPEPMPQLSVVLSGTQSTSAIPTQPIGSTFSVDVRAENLMGIKPGVCAIGYELIWNPSVLSFTSYSDNNWLPDQMNLDIISSQWISIGTAIISQIAFDTNSAWACTTFSGSVTATFTFRVISGGSSSINLQTQEGLTGFVAYPMVVETGIVESVLKGPTSISNAVYGKPVAACDNALVKGGSASVIDSSAGITVDLSGSSAPDNTNLAITSTNYGVDLPEGISKFAVGDGIGYYDVKASSDVSFGSDASAAISFSNPAFTSSCFISYWDGSQWVELATTYTAPNTVSCSIPAADLSGTPFAVSAFSLVDFYRTGTVDFNDVLCFAAAYIQYQQTGVLNPACDLNHDGVLNFNDIVIFVADYQEAAQSQP